MYTFKKLQHQGEGKIWKQFFPSLESLIFFYTALLMGDRVGVYFGSAQSDICLSVSTPLNHEDE